MLGQQLSARPAIDGFKILTSKKEHYFISYCYYYYNIFFNHNEPQLLAKTKS